MVLFFPSCEQTVFDSMRKVTSSLPFRAQGLLTLSVFVQDYLHKLSQNGRLLNLWVAVAFRLS